MTAKKKASKKKIAAKKKVSRKKAVTKVELKSKFELSKTMTRKLPESEREYASKKLWEKSEGLCALCNRPLGVDSNSVAADHRVAESDNGKTTLSNLYLAHKQCNSSRKNLPFNIAQPLV